MRRMIVRAPSSDRQPCEFPLHESANAQDPRNELSAWHSQDLLGAKPFASSRHQSNARLAGHGADGFCLLKLMWSGDTKSAPLKSMKATVPTGGENSYFRHTRCRLLCPMRP